MDEYGWQERLWSQESINVRKILSFSESEFKLQDLLEKEKKALSQIFSLAQTINILTNS